jgi:hypothetical protein
MSHSVLLFVIVNMGIEDLWRVVRLRATSIEISRTGGLKKNKPVVRIMQGMRLRQ